MAILCIYLSTYSLALVYDFHSDDLIDVHPLQKNYPMTNPSSSSWQASSADDADIVLCSRQGMLSFSERYYTYFPIRSQRQYRPGFPPMNSFRSNKACSTHIFLIKTGRYRLSVVRRRSGRRRTRRTHSLCTQRSLLEQRKALLERRNDRAGHRISV